MSAAVELRRGWCPTALRPMASGDGLLVRLAMPGGVLRAGAAHTIADCARRFGNGFIDLTQRANLQLRGVSEATLPALIRRLDTLGLVPPDSEPEAARAIIASPLAGLDPDAAFDIRPVVAALQARLAAEPALAALPAKFCWLVDDDGRLPLDDIAADIRFVAARHGRKPRFSVALGGHTSDAAVIGTCAASGLPNIAVALACAFLDLAGSGVNAPRHMRDLMARDGVRTIAEAVQRGSLSPRRWGEGSQPRTKVRSEQGEEGGEIGSPLTRLELCSNHPLPTCAGKGKAQLISLHHLASDTAALGVGAPFGRLTVSQLNTLADTADGELRLTPWRAVLVPCDASRAKALGAQLAQAGLVADPTDPRLAVTACTGAPACPRGTTPTREDAAMLAPLARRLGEGLTLHVSGCVKGCARAAPARVTLVGRAGCYDLVTDGAAGDAPIAVGLTPTDAAAALVHLGARRPGIQPYVSLEVAR